MGLKEIMTERTGLNREWPRSFDVIGEIAIVEIPERLMGYAREIGDAILSMNRHVKTVYAKLSERTGEYRLRRLKLIAGERKEVTLHRENGYVLKVNVRRDYFSPREGTERMRVLKFVGEGERCMVFFAGVGPYPICLAKHRRCESVGIEINPSAVRHFRENIRLNKLSSVRAVLGDVKELYNGFGSFDHVFMPYPAKAYEFLGEAVEIADTVHFYFFADRWEKGLDMVEKFVKPRVVDARKVLPYAPGIWKWRLTFSFS